jgi:hypothetical protein
MWMDECIIHVHISRVCLVFQRCQNSVVYAANVAIYIVMPSGAFIRTHILRHCML